MEQIRPNIKIILAYHNRRCPVLQSDILCPVQTGSASADRLFPDMLHDNEGENISEQNLKYNELTALYWAWKNQDRLGNPDFVGLMHDRRHFLFNPQLPIPNKHITWLPQSPIYMFPPVCKKYQSYLTDSAIRHYFPQYDVMVLKPYDNTPRIIKGTMRDRFLCSPGMTYEIFDVWAAAVKQLYPDYTAEVEQFSKGTTEYMCNMFVLRKDLFDEYCQFLFAVLQQVDAQVDSADFSDDKKRFLGYLGEFTLSLFIMKLKQRTNIRIIERPGVFFLDPKHKKYNKLSRYYLASHLLWGKLRARYQKKYNELKAEKDIFEFFQ